MRMICKIAQYGLNRQSQKLYVGIWGAYYIRRMKQSLRIRMIQVLLIAVMLIISFRLGMILQRYICHKVYDASIANCSITLQLLHEDLEECENSKQIEEWHSSKLSPKTAGLFKPTRYIEKIVYLHIFLYYKGGGVNFYIMYIDLSLFFRLNGSIVICNQKRESHIHIPCSLELYMSIFHFMLWRVIHKRIFANRSKKSSKDDLWIATKKDDI